MMEDMHKGDQIKLLDDRYQDYLEDESRISGHAQSISFPKTEEEVQQIVKTCIKKQLPITVQGSRTGITGAAVPVTGHILNLSNMKKIIGLAQENSQGFLIKIQPGLSLLELNQQLASLRFDCSTWNKSSIKALISLKTAGRWFWPPDPSESTASIGGIASNNAMGICAHHYGPARQHIKSIRMVDPKGNIHSIKRNQYFFSNGICQLPGGVKLKVDPLSLKIKDQTDLLDVYLGSEGMLGVITELELILQPAPSEIWGIVFFFTSQVQALGFVQTVFERQKIKNEKGIVAYEFMDHTTLKCIQQLKQKNSSLNRLPDIEIQFNCAIYLEIHTNSDKKLEIITDNIMDAADEFSCNLDTTWAFSNGFEIEQGRQFRHAAPESVNHMIDQLRLKDPRIHKLGTDMQIKTDDFIDLLEIYQEDLNRNKLKAAIFGHVADGLFHVNILPEDYDQFIKAKTLIEKWAQKIHLFGGTIVTEHGVGKIKKHLFKSVPLPDSLKMIQLIKQQLDPSGMWNPGNMLD
jgi:D-lactate dehydrogenase (cytochrome)